MFEKFKIKEMCIEGLKSVGKGSVKFEENKSSGGSVLGIYGQNGSGKTSLIEGMDIILKLINNNLEYNILKNLFSKDSDKCRIYIVFNAVKDKLKMEYRYEIIFEKTNDEINLISELIRYKDDNKNMIIDLASFNFKNEDRVTPKNRFGILNNKELKSYEDVVIFSKETHECKSLFFLNEKFISFMKEEKFDKNLIEKIENLYLNIKFNIFTVGTLEAGLSQAGIFLPLTVHTLNDGIVTKAILPINLQGPTSSIEDEYNVIEKEVNGISKTLEALVPGLKLDIINLGSSLNENTEKMINFELITKRGDIKIPLKYESEGIKKIISIMGIIKSVYKNPNVIAFIDELDSGIFEYLLGELIEQISKFGEGQLLFTSHNFRILEVLSYKNIYFSTTNRQDRFKKMKKILSNNNLRKKYYEAIQLGTDDIEFYANTKPYEIREGLEE